MKKLALALVCVLMVGLFTNCGGGNEPQGANLFIEVPQSDGIDVYEIFTVMFLPPGESAGYGKNVWNKCLGITRIGNYDYYMFRAPRKQLDIYIEAHYDYYGTAAYYGDHFSNERVSVNLKANDWARLDTEGNDHNGIQYRAVQGSGPIQ